MSHYFTKDQSEVASHKRLIYATVLNQQFSFETDAGVFSTKGLDFGSRLLLESITVAKNLSVLDLGCGYGPIGIVVNRVFRAEVWCSDVNLRALALTDENAKRNQATIKTIESNGFEQIDGVFDLILCNPPIRAGKKVIYSLFRQAFIHLTNSGKFIIVIRKDQGAESAKNELESIFPKVAVIAKKSGYFILECLKTID